ncbi:MAG: hypothetical protein UU77_C0055G0002 [candidate division WWE3 bacterium GW2011_GWC1_41_7]|uniref:Uncharacterized protein n=3 Tax=Katanobacteria TaxID=422282 RepID=A0A0G0ZAT6_UNCKA|nr:MAG: hypothetical protein UU72_C0024G0014 [candidate division WWE3 bacterium GW2011_GWB1_41_6]KKS19191.1 MAG: hypothetical protein UU77_C0055G0002 [candidate division WWE3 bacterium GW2011_GWC1_41_7]OGC57834.1 MAG: hypothetical protein A2976_01945 [candidate division WWE3 bacterium RIFCSPLOWO2_01_FULL_41_9]
MNWKLVQNVYAVSTELEDPLGGRFTSLSSVFGWAINIVIGVGWALVFIFLALGFIRYITSRGDPKSAAGAQSSLVHTLIGGVGLFFLTAFRFIITGLLGAEENLGPPEITGFLVNR